jgi:hypothetical protein
MTFKVMPRVTWKENDKGVAVTVTLDNQSKDFIYAFEFSHDEVNYHMPEIRMKLKEAAGILIADCISQEF